MSKDTSFADLRKSCEQGSLDDADPFRPSGPGSKQ